MWSDPGLIAWQTEPALASSYDELPSTVAFNHVSPAAAVQLRAQIESHIPSKDVLRTMVTSYFKYSLSLLVPPIREYRLLC
jgi:hypothetical protein